MVHFHHSRPLPPRPLITASALLLVFGFGASALFAFGCGAQHREVLPPAPVEKYCPSIAELAPVLAEAIDTSDPANLRAIIERYGLTKQGVDGSPSPIQSVFWLLLRTVNDMGQDLPEAGAPEGERCNDLAPPPPTDSNRICEARRLLELFIHEAAALESLDLLSSVMSGVLAEIAGSSPDKPPRTEILGIIGEGCRRKDVCDALDLFDLVIGVLGFIEPTADEPNRPRDLLDKVRRVALHPSLSGSVGLLEGALTTEALISFVNLIIDNLMVLPTTGDEFAVRYHEGVEVPINALLTSAGITRTDPAYASLREAIDGLLGGHEEVSEPHDSGARPVIYDLLDPAGPWRILQPLQGFLHCWRSVDPATQLVRFFLELDAIEGIENLEQGIGVLEALIAVDERIALMTFTRLTLAMLRGDEEGTAGFRKICGALLDDTPDPITGKSSIDLFLPDVLSFFETDTLSELVCLLDAFLYGCAGGERPACQNGSKGL
ncbi:MAG: hypothetical protein LBM75_09720 [Myxococcales bacterium]|jgi:hypothetical protein|nr:hypothetical protein [Myxococcales bacterium]